MSAVELLQTERDRLQGIVEALKVDVDHLQDDLDKKKAEREEYQAELKSVKGAIRTLTEITDEEGNPIP